MEKTLDELIKEKYKNVFQFLSEPDQIEFLEFHRDLLERVRISTIEECKEAFWNKYGLQASTREYFNRLDNMKTDRIKIKNPNE